jgi:hypothetical protein
VGDAKNETVTLSDPDKDDSVTLKISGKAPPGSVIYDVTDQPMKNIYSWKPTDTKSYKLTLSATDKLKAETLLDVEVRVCNCDTNGQCEYKEVLEKKNPGRCLTKV